MRIVFNKLVEHHALFAIRLLVVEVEHALVLLQKGHKQLHAFLLELQLL